MKTKSQGLFAAGDRVRVLGGSFEGEEGAVKIVGVMITVLLDSNPGQTYSFGYRAIEKVL